MVVGGGSETIAGCGWSWVVGWKYGWLCVLASKLWLVMGQRSKIMAGCVEVVGGHG